MAAGRWRALAVLALVEILGMSVWFGANAVASQLALRWSLSSSEVGWLSTVVQIGFVLGTAVAALLNLADIIPSRRYLAGAATLAALANLALLVVPGYAGALVARTLTGVFLAGVYPPAMRMASTWFVRQRGMAIGVVVGALTVGKALPYLIHAWPGATPRAVILLSSAAALVAAALVLAGYHDGPVEFPVRRFSPTLVVTVLRNARYRQAVGGYVGHMLELYACWIWLPAFVAASTTAHGDHIGSSGLSALSFAVLAIGAVGCVAGGLRADRTGHVKLVVQAMAVSGLCALLTPLAYGHSLAILLPLLLVWSISVIADSAQFSTLVTHVVPPDAVGTALTLQTSLGFLATMITIQLVPVIVAAAGWRWAFPMLAVGPALGIAAVRRLRV